MRRLYRRRGPFKVITKIKTIKYRGFYIDLYNNNQYDFKYEWKVRPIGPTSLRLTKQGGKLHKVIHDPTSMPNTKATILYAKYLVQDLHRPFHFR